MLGGVPFNYPTVIAAMNAVYQSNVNGTICNTPLGYDEANTETIPAYMLSTWLFEGEMKNETGNWITELENANITSISNSNDTLLIQAIGNTSSILKITNETSSYNVTVTDFSTIIITLPEFSVLLVPPLFMATTIFAALVFRKKFQRRSR